MQLCITQITQALPDCLKLDTQAGCFVTRALYLPPVTRSLLEKNTAQKDLSLLLDATQSEQVMGAVLCFRAEKQALSLIARAEQSRYGLFIKLKKKDFPTYAIKAALDFLEAKDYISDKRFATFWLQTHLISKPQGKKRLFVELQKRGIDTKTALLAIEQYFCSPQKEEELCKRAFEKYTRCSVDRQKTISFLQRSGFPLPLVLKITKM